MESQHGTWSNRLAFIFAATGSAVGLGNIWKFPYMTGENGGGAFVIIYLLCIACIGIPIMIAEVMLGRMGRQSPINTMLSLSKTYGRSSAWSSIGWMGVAAGFIILSYYAVIAGWILHYMFLIAQGHFTGADGEFVSNTFSDFTADVSLMMFWFTLFMIITVTIISRGVKRGLELFVKWAMPLLFLLMFVLLGYSMVSGDFARGVTFLFSFNIADLSSEAVLSAMGHAFFTLSIGMGAIMAYGSYLPRKVSIVSTVGVIAVLDTLVALIAGLAIFPIVFTNGLQPDAGPGLLFQAIPLAFGNLPAGSLFGALFFLLVSFAALTSAISLVEPALAFFVEKYKMKRLYAAIIIGFTCWVLGIGTVFSFNIWSDFHIVQSMTIFDFVDSVSQKILLPFGGFLIALYVAYKMPVQAVIENLDLAKKHTHVWKALIGVIAPLSIVIIFLHSLGVFKLIF
ncbi:MAG: sodium-dependent transporter [Bdellovibrionales bacterium]|nr:sodium-dependent transporter [Bdellovibrionales bacterium]